MQQRGVLLCTCSKGNEDVSFEAWEAIESIAINDKLPHVLRRSDADPAVVLMPEVALAAAYESAVAAEGAA